MKFFVDKSLGGLTKWLRFIGFDVVQINLTPQELQKLPAPVMDCVILTKQTSLKQKMPRPDLFILASDHPETQLMEICRHLNLSPTAWEPLKRCSRCNQTLLPLPPEQAEGRVPDYITQKHHQFLECPQCRRVFWEGSHQRHIRRRLQELQNHLKTA